MVDDQDGRYVHVLIMNIFISRVVPPYLRAICCQQAEATACTKCLFFRYNLFTPSTTFDIAALIIIDSSSAGGVIFRSDQRKPPMLARKPSNCSVHILSSAGIPVVSGLHMASLRSWSNISKMPAIVLRSSCLAQCTLTFR